ncbi:unannotated protein [freshwater metagenome]|uniref:Unannotated protein n=1 Tax=freshwater metagenome TaxID=449393 RepID=A0A6J6GKP3_9ZZZZ|nr:hypothetical protein [Actinomycetota bacterium]
MTAAAGEQSGARTRKPTARHLGSIFCAILFFVTFTLGVTSIWTRMTVFDSARFAERAERVLDSQAVRSKLADEITDAIINTGPSNLASFRTIIRSTLDPILQTPAFRSIFRRALDTSHDYLFTQSGNTQVINLSESLNVLSGSLQATNPDLATSIPTGTNELLVKIGDQTRGLGLWRIAERLTLAGAGLLLAAGLFAFGTIALDTNRHRSTFALGISAAFSGIVMFVLATIAPIIAGSYANDPDTERAFVSAAEFFVSDYRLYSIWIVGFGVVLCAFGTATAPHGEAVTVRSVIDRARFVIDRHKPTSQRGQIVHAVLLMVIGFIIVIERETVIPLLVIVVGAVLAYVGASQLLSIVGRRSTVTTRSAALADVKEVRLNNPTMRVALMVTVLLISIGAGAWFTTSDARSQTAANEQRKCNGFPELCDKPLNEVAFLGAHNAMSTAADPGWLFYEQTKSIPAQLDFGVRALLVKTHYGIPTTVNITGANAVITDSIAELAVNPIDQDDQYSNQQQAKAKELQANIKVDPNLRDVYLCHVYCEYGATKFTTALGYTRQFLNDNPDNVIIWFIGDYVSKADTEKALREAKVFDRVWDYDPTAPMPTLGEMIDAKKNIVMISEFSGAPPAWNIKGYGVFQDTPFTFRKDSELYAPGSSKYTGTATVEGPIPATVTGADGTEQWTKDWAGIPSCAPNRGTPRSPLFQINHWITPAGAAPTIGEAKDVNAYDVLMPRVRDCMTQRGKFPTIVGVNFVEIGDALQVVNELNSGKILPISAP